MNLTDDQMQQKREVCDSLFQCTQENEECVKRVISGDGSWVIQYDPEAEQQIV
jgi:hypothetical protein